MIELKWFPISKRSSNHGTANFAPHRFEMVFGKIPKNVIESPSVSFEIVSCKEEKIVVHSPRRSLSDRFETAQRSNENVVIYCPRDQKDLYSTQDKFEAPKVPNFKSI